MNLCESLIKAQDGDNEGFLSIVDKFNPTIHKFGNELGYDGANEDLILKLLEFLRDPRKQKIILTSEGAAVNYIYKLLRSKKNDLFRKKCRGVTEVLATPEIINTYSYKPSFENQLIVNEALGSLPIKHKQIMVMRYLKGYSDKEIAMTMGISRQAVCKIRNKSIQKLRKILSW